MLLLQLQRLGLAILIVELRLRIHLELCLFPLARALLALDPVQEAGLDARHRIAYPSAGGSRITVRVAP